MNALELPNNGAELNAHNDACSHRRDRKTHLIDVVPNKGADVVVPVLNSEVDEDEPNNGFEDPNILLCCAQNRPTEGRITKIQNLLHKYRNRIVCSKAVHIEESLYKWRFSAVLWWDVMDACGQRARTCAVRSYVHYIPP